MTSAVSTRSMNHSLMHPFDVESRQNESLDLFAEELPEQVQLVANVWADCASSASSFSSVGGCIASFSSMGSIISCG
jgi:hypothetical protein